MKYIFLDEPTTGLDPQTKRTVWKAIKQASIGNTVILTTHSMEEADALCDRIGILVAGQLRAIGTAQHLKIRFGSGYKIVIQGTEMGIYKVIDKLKAIINSITQLEFQPIIGTDNKYKSQLFFKEKCQLSHIWICLFESKTEDLITEYSINYTDLEDVFLKIVDRIEPAEQCCLQSNDDVE
ncbi:ABC transporter family protein [Spironucleus salmonicida]|uniref:ABC transporter family protein n=1 Tax=Spironucleus salmonicida TaxID=348837 RepID=V6LFF0_9EUKA|nr:ABC transporter family protein [Spironucleus salmonicida]|eukprot:EST43265.1 ABC transporter family protein [Spironucleus salmonicida]